MVVAVEAVVVVVLVAVVVGAAEVVFEVDTVEVVGTALVVSVVMLVVVAIVVVAVVVIVVFWALVVGEISALVMELMDLLQAAVSIVAPPAAIKARNLRRVISFRENCSATLFNWLSIGLLTVFILFEPPFLSSRLSNDRYCSVNGALFFYYCS